MSMNLAPRRTDTSAQRTSTSLAPRLSDSAHNSPSLPNYTERACALADKEFEDDEVNSAQEIFEELLDTPSGRDFLNLQAAVLRARKRGTLRIELQRESTDVPWGIRFFKPMQLEALGWTSDQVGDAHVHFEKMQSAFQSCWAYEHQTSPLTIIYPCTAQISNAMFSY